MQIRFDEHDFEKLFTNSHPWTPGFAADDRWEFETSSDPGRGRGSDLDKWAFAYWVPEWARVILMRSWLDEQSHRYDVVYDTPSDEYVILTDYAALVWQRHADRR